VNRLNYGLAIDSSGNFQVIDTSIAPGLRDDYSYHLSEPFIFYVAPALDVDIHFNINHLVGGPYVHLRAMLIKFQAEQLKDFILTWHGVKEKIVKTTW
jgi:hypothetical protein